jgi:hypothetical protein
MRLPTILALALLCTACAPAKAATLKATPATLAAAIASARGGDTILLSPGPPADIVVRGRTFSPQLTITSADPKRPAVLGGLQLSGVTGVRLVNVDVHQAASEDVKNGSPAIFIQSSHGIDIVGAHVSGSKSEAEGLYLGKGVSLLDSDHVTITGAEVSGFFKGVSFANISDSSLEASDLHDIRTSPVNGGGDLQRVRIVGNHIHDIIPDRTHGDHSDGIHFFTKNSPKPCDGLVITDNRMELSDAVGTLGINLQGTPEPGGFTNVKVNGNTLRWNNNQGITTNWVQSGEFKNNVLTPAPGLDDPKHAPGFIFRNSGPDVEVSGNTSKDGKSMAPYRKNTFLSAAQIAKAVTASDKAAAKGDPD